MKKISFGLKAFALISLQLVSFTAFADEPLVAPPASEEKAVAELAEVHDKSLHEKLHDSNLELREKETKLEAGNYKVIGDAFSDVAPKVSHTMNDLTKGVVASRSKKEQLEADIKSGNEKKEYNAECFLYRYPTITETDKIKNMLAGTQSADKIVVEESIIAKDDICI